MIKIKTLNENYTGTIANIVFVAGVATVDTISEDLKKWFEEKGATVIEEETKVKKK